MGTHTAVRTPHGPDDTDRTRESIVRIRQRFSRFTAEDAKLLAGLRPTFKRHAAAVVDRFYEHLEQFDELRPLLGDAKKLARLKRTQRAYVLSLTAGTYDEEFARTRLAIGAAHERIGLAPQWYLGTYGLYMDLLTPHVHEHYRKQPDRAARAGVALSKLFILDMQVVLDAYYERRHKRAVERSQQLAAVGELAASIAHEVRNPLAGMKGALEVLRSELAVKPANLEIVDELLAQIVRLEGLVRDLLTYARPHTVSRRTIDLHDLLDRLIRRHKEEADRLGITVHRIYGPGTGALAADPEQLEQVFLNLIHNSIQAMEQGGTLTVSTESRDGEIAVVLCDTGKGIKPEELSRIFQPFFTTKHRGSGLGLSIVKKIVEGHDGSVEIQSTAGKGTDVLVRLPAS